MDADRDSYEDSYKSATERYYKEQLREGIKDPIGKEREGAALEHGFISKNGQGGLISSSVWMKIAARMYMKSTTICAIRTNAFPLPVKS